MNKQIQTDTKKKVFVDFDGYDRIRLHSPEYINQKIQRRTEKRVHDIGSKDFQTLTRRIEQLEREWDIDRALMAFFASVGSSALLLGLVKSRRWFALSIVQFFFIGYHSTVGWCPPMALFRRLGFRSTKEIDAEKYALKTLRGDYRISRPINPMQ